MSDTFQHYIDGEWTDGSGSETFTSENPANGETLGEFHRGTPEYVERALDAADDAFEEWRELSHIDRAEYLWDVYHELKDRHQELGEVVTKECGKEISEGKADVTEAWHMVEWAAGNARHPHGDIVPSEIASKDAYMRRKPRGVVGCITPWNFPVAIPFWHMAIALVEGNTVVWKPAEQTPWCGQIIAEMLEDAGVPEGVFNMVQGFGDAGAEIVENDVTDTVLFTGSAEDVDPTALDDDAPAEYDLVVFANVLNELADPAAVLETYGNAVASDGALVALAPADENTATGLRDAERALVKTTDATVYSPTVRLWPGREPSDSGWTFDVQSDLDVPDFQRRLDDATPETDDDHTPGEFVNVDVQYAYSILRMDGQRRLEVTATPNQYAPMAETETHVPNRIKTIAVKLSHDLTDREDANPLYKLGDGSQGTDHYAVLTNETALNDALQYADYGDLLTFDGVLALWNDDEGAYNLVVDEHTTVDHVPAPL
jgi:SAM-dependent methyltransferase